MAQTIRSSSRQVPATDLVPGTTYSPILKFDNFKFQGLTPKPFTNRSSFLSKAALGSVLLLAVLLRLPRMRLSLWYDEISSAHAYVKDVFHWLEACLYHTNMPTHYTLMYFWTKIFPDTEFSLRFLPLVFGILSIAVTYFLVKKYFDRKTALLTSLLMALSPVHIWYSTEARPYAGMMGLLLFALLAWTCASDPAPESDKHRTLWCAAYFVSLLLLVFSHLYMILYFPLFALLIVTGKAPGKSSLLTLTGLVFLIFCFFLLIKYGTSVPTGDSYLRRFTFKQLWLLFFNWFSLGNSVWVISPHRFLWKRLVELPWLGLSQLFFFFLFLKGSLALVTEKDPAGRKAGGVVLAFLFCVPVFLGALNLAGFSKTYIERSALTSLPFFFLVLARSITSISRRSLRRLFLCPLLLLTGAGTAGLFLHPAVYTVNDPKIDWRAAARYLKGDIGGARESTAVVYWLPPYMLSYYDQAFMEDAPVEQSLNRLSEIFNPLPGPGHFLSRFFLEQKKESERQFKALRKDKITLLGYQVLIQSKLPAYRTFYVLRDSYKGSSRFDPVINGFLSHPQFYFLGKTVVSGFDIYKFQRGA